MLFLTIIIWLWFVNVNNGNNLFMVKHYTEKNKYQYYCGTNSVLGLSCFSNEEVVQGESIFLKHKSEINFVNSISPLNWKTQNSLTGPINEIILDRRWEDLNLLTIHSKTQENGNTINSIQAANLSMMRENNFVIPLSVKFNYEAYVFLCDGEDEFESNCYWFTLQRSGGLKIILRNCSKVNMTNCLNEGMSCRDLSVKATKFVYTCCKKWLHFKLIKTGNRLKLLISDEENKMVAAMEYEDSKYIFRIQYVIVSNNSTEKTFYKIHNINYNLTTKKLFEKPLAKISNIANNFVCVSMFLSMCQNCLLTLTLKNMDSSQIIKQKTYRFTSWNEIKFLVEDIKVNKAILLVSTTSANSSKAFWALDGLRTCQKEEYRFISVTSNKNLQCELMKYNNQQTISMSEEMENIENNCPENTVTRFCIPCFWNENGKCGRLKICENYNGKKICYCSAGYKNNDWQCSSSCFSKTYGHGCKKECKYCQDSEKSPSTYKGGMLFGLYYMPPQRPRRPSDVVCDHIDGTCKRPECTENYSGPKCDIPPLIFKQAPEIISISYTLAKIQIRNFKLRQSCSKIDIIRYTLQYKAESDERWTNYPHSYNFGETKLIHINQLMTGTRYIIRGVVIASDGTFYEHSSIPSAYFITKCDDIPQDSITVTSTDARVEIIIRGENVCGLNFYKIMIPNIGEPTFQNNTNARFDYLTSSTSYKIIFEKPSHNFEIYFRTKTKGL